MDNFLNLDYIRNQTSALIGYWDKQLINQYSNAAHFRWFGQSPEQIKGQHLQELLGVVLYQDLLSEIEGALQGNVQYFERHLTNANTGDKSHGLMRFLPDIAADQVNGFYFVCFDITNQDRLQDSKQKKLTILESLTKGVVLTDPLNKVFYTNAAFERTSGYSLQELIGTDFNVLQGPDTDAIEIQNIKAAITSNSAYHGELLIYRKNGIGFYCEINLNPIVDSAGKLSQFLYFLRDITGEKQKQEQLLLLSSCVSAMIESVIISDATTIDLPGPRIVYVNEAFSTQTGYSREEVMGKTPRIMQGPKTDRASLDKIRKALTRWQPINIDVLNYTKGGKEFWQNLDIFPLANSDGWYTHWISIQRDVTVHKLEEQARLEAEQVTLMKAQFLANMSHEIRTPMNAVIGLSNLALECTDTEEIKQHVAHINTAATGLMKILNDLLELSKIQEIGVLINPHNFIVKDLYSSLSALFTLTTQQSGVSFEILCDPLIPETLWGDDLRIKQVLVNLLGNAFKFTQQGKVSLVISLIDGSVVQPNTVNLKFSVTDTGIGLSNEQIPLIFDRFSQADVSITRQYGGSGLGLTISQELIKAMGGEIQVQSQLGQGSEFSFTLEFERDNQAQMSSATVIATHAEDVLQGKFALVAEDNKLNQLVTRLLLKKLGIECDIAENGALALECIKSKHFDLVLMDIQMPVMDGLEATQQIRAIDAYKTLPIIAISSGVMLEDQQAYSAVGMNGFIPKPTSLENMSAELLRLFK